MDRPCFLLVDQDYAGHISTRKLVIETAKFNTITAYDPEEAIATLRRFPKVDGVVVNADTANSEDCEDILSQLRSIVPGIDIVILTAGGQPRCSHREHYVDSLDPKNLLECLQSLRKEATDEIIRRDAQILHES